MVKRFEPPPMTKTQRKNAWMRARTRELRAWLIELLGGECVECKSAEELEFDHIEKRDWPIHGRNQYARILAYVREARQGLIQLLCKSCNSRKWVPGRSRSRREEEEANVGNECDIPF